MEAIFSLPYSEYEAIIQIQKYFKKKENYAILIPTSRQQKGIDFVIINTKNSKLLRIQVKSSRSYIDSKVAPKNKRERYKVNFWFSNFKDRYNKKDVDYYLLFGLYPHYDKQNNIKSKTKFWKSVILAFDNAEMFKLLKKVKTKKEKKSDRFFGISFDEITNIYGARGFHNKPNLTNHLLQNQVTIMKKRIS